MEATNKESNMEATESITITVQASDARLMGEALFELRRNWADDANQAAQAGDTDGMNFALMRKVAAERVASELHGAGWAATL
jgi:hypothetical protein